VILYVVGLFGSAWRDDHELWVADTLSSFLVIRHRKGFTMVSRAHEIWKDVRSIEHPSKTMTTNQYRRSQTLMPPQHPGAPGAGAEASVRSTTNASRGGKDQQSNSFRSCFALAHCETFEIIWGCQGVLAFLCTGVHNIVLMPSNVIPNGTLASESQASKAITLLLVVTLAISVV